MVLLKMPLAQPGLLLELRQLQQAEKGETVQNPGHHHTGNGVYRPPELIASIALSHARTAEHETERDGLLYLLAEILAAQHRIAEAFERTATACEESNRITCTGEP
jgi:hypothetical protein